MAAAAAALTLEQLEGDPHPHLARLREREPVSWQPALGAWLVTRRDLALAVMRDSATFTVDDPRFSTARVVGPSMLSLDGAEHDRHRAPFVEPFRREAVLERFAALVAAEAERLLDELCNAGGRTPPSRDGGVRPHASHAELRRGFAGPLAAAVVVDALGITGATPTAVLDWYDAIVGAVTDVTAGRELPERGRDAFARLRAAVADLPVAGLSRDEVAGNAAVLLFGGIETTEGMIANAILHLLATGEPVSPAAVEESLRLEPAAATVDRYATRDVELGGATIARGDLVTVSIAAANRDPATFPDPDRFDPARPNAGRHLAFAAGPHVCLGMHLARLEAHTAIERLLARFPDLRLDPARPAAPRGLVFRKPPELHVVWGSSP